MKCPHCTQHTLVMSERQGIEIDYCPNCRGIWLDRGELDKLLEKAAESMPQPAMPSNQSIHPATHAHEKVVYVDDSRHRRRKHESWLSDLFD